MWSFMNPPAALQRDQATVGWARGLGWEDAGWHGAATVAARFTKKLCEFAFWSPLRRAHKVPTANASQQKMQIPKTKLP